MDTIPDVVENLKQRLSVSPLPKGWTLCPDTTNITFVKVLLEHSKAPLILSVVIDESLLWHVYVYQKPVATNIPLFQNTPPKLCSIDAISSFLQLINSSNVCVGNNGNQYKVLREWKNKSFLNKKSNSSA